MLRMYLDTFETIHFQVLQIPCFQTCQYPTYWDEWKLCWGENCTGQRQELVTLRCFEIIAGVFEKVSTTSFHPLEVKGNVESQQNSDSKRQLVIAFSKLDFLTRNHPNFIREVQELHILVIWWEIVQSLLLWRWLLVLKSGPLTHLAGISCRFSLGCLIAARF